MNENRDKWCENVILVDADYVDKVAFDLIVNFERMLGRRIPQGDMARWLECIALDGGLRPQTSDTRHQTSIQVVLLHKQAQMQNFQPGVFADLDGKALHWTAGRVYGQLRTGRRDGNDGRPVHRLHAGHQQCRRGTTPHRGAKR